MESSDCKLCAETYSESIRPRVLQCGHSYCSGCLENLIKDVKISCPTCMKEHPCVSSSDLPINYDLEQSISDLKRLGGSGQPNKFQPNIRKKTTHRFIAEQVSNAKELLLSTEDMETQLETYSKFLYTYLGDQEELHRKLRNMMKWHESIIKKTKKETQKIAELQEDLKNNHESLIEILPSITNECHEAMNRSSADDLAKVLVNMDVLGNMVEKSKLEFPNRELTAWQKGLKSLEEMLNVLETLNVTESHRKGDLLLTSIHLDDKLTILEKFTKSKEEASSVTADEMKRNPDFWKKTIASGKVFAVKSSHRSLRFAEMTIEDDKVYLYHLQDRKIPPSAYTIEHSEALRVLDKDSTTAFLDLEWDGSFKGRVHISLSPDTPLAQQFRILCTGDQGPTYAQTKIFQVVNKGQDLEYIWGGDYMSNDGSGNTALMEGLDLSDPVYKRVGEAGAVWARDGTKSAQFGIITDKGRTIIYSKIFGKVKDGMNVLRSAVERIERVNDVMVVKCGIILPL
ncbi:tripartite motif containing 13-like isoform X1 [Palaemon carinicauda]|uniref:tripartite motif containing 13-like isoform X1 n=1 Tax=Palaemon carinicauda TaxID=392227 RepID=UPI0035B69C1D